MVQRSERKWRRLYRLAGDAPDNFVTLGQTVRGMRDNTGLNVKSRHETGGLRFVMSRLPRLTVPGYPHHVIQRGHNRQAIFLDDTDPVSSPMKAKGVGELGLCGVSAAIANAIYNATGIRVRDYPVTLDKLIEGLPELG